MNWDKVKLGFWSAIGGAVLLAIVGFSWGGWVTESTSRRMNAEMTSTALVERLTPLCLAQFNQDPEKSEKLAALKKVNSWERRNYVEKQGWATLSSETEPDSQIALECVSRIMQSSS